MRTLALLALLPLAACGDSVSFEVSTGSDGPSVQSEVQNYLEGIGIDVASMACDDVTSTPSAEVGAVIGTHLCTVEQPVGEPFEVYAETTNAVEPDGTPKVTWSAETRNVVVVSTIETRLSDQFAEASGLPIEVRCETPRVVPSTPGETFSCALTGAPKPQQVVITITSATGSIDYEVVG